MYLLTKIPIGIPARANETSTMFCPFFSSEPLEQMARLRLLYPEASLLELGKMLTPVVGKSGVNHRLRKLKEIAEDLRRKQGGEVL